jgi:hypothetical protein
MPSIIEFRKEFVLSIEGPTSSCRSVVDEQLVGVDAMYMVETYTKD